MEKTGDLFEITVNNSKRLIQNQLEGLQKSGVWVKGIQVDWSSEIRDPNVAHPYTDLKCKVHFEAEL